MYFVSVTFAEYVDHGEGGGHCGCWKGAKGRLAAYEGAGERYLAPKAYSPAWPCFMQDAAAMQPAAAALPLTLHLCWKACREFPQLRELRAQLQLRSVHEHTDDCLRGAGVGDDLTGEEDAPVFVVGIYGAVIYLLDPLEEEYKAVNGFQVVEQVAVHAPQLRHLHTLNAHALDQLSEHAWVGFNCICTSVDEMKHTPSVI
jgi:hypothetical protein